jgi:hypothetical protein
MTESYPEAIIGAKPTKEELYALHLEACIANKVVDMLHRCFWFVGGLKKVEEIIEEAPASTALCEELRKDPAHAKIALNSEDVFSGLAKFVDELWPLNYSKSDVHRWIERRCQCRGWNDEM